MRLSQSRGSKLVALVVALATVFALIGARDRLTRRDRNGVVRMTRGGLQRLDATDSVNHEESPDPTVARTPERTSDALSELPGGPASTSALGSGSTASISLASPRAPSTLTSSTLDRTVGRFDEESRTGRAIAPAVGYVPGPPGDFVVLTLLSDHPAVIDRPHQPSLGRAPPSSL